MLFFSLTWRPKHWNLKVSFKRGSFCIPLLLLSKPFKRLFCFFSLEPCLSKRVKQKSTSKRSRGAVKVLNGTVCVCVCLRVKSKKERLPSLEGKESRENISSRIKTTSHNSEGQQRPPRLGMFQKR